MTSVSAQSLIKETSTTTGTGSYTLAGAVTDFRAFSAGYTAGAGCYVPYVARMGSGWEIGVGELTDATTLVRTKVHESSNAGAAVNWGAGTKTIICGTGGKSGFAGIHKFNADVPPTSTTGQRADGFGPGSLWNVSQPMTGGGAFEAMMMNMVEESDGFDSGNWQFIFPGLQPAWDYDFTEYGYNFGVPLHDCVAHLPADPFGAFGFGQGAKMRWSGATYHAIWGAGDYGSHQHAVGVMLQADTANATPTVMTNMDGWAGTNKFTVEESCVLLCKARVVARCDADDDVSVWELTFAVKRDAAADPAIVGSVAGTTAFAQDAGAAAWAVSVGINTTDDTIEFTVTGAAAKTIAWTCAVDVTQAAAL